MRRFNIRGVAGGALGVLAFILSCGDAHATDCASLPNPVYGAGGSAQVPLLKQIGGQLSALATPITLVYSSAAGACIGYDNLVTPTPITGTANYWDATGAQLNCDLSIDGDPTTFAVMGNAPTLCPGGAAVPTGFGEFLGPAQSVDFIVPSGSNEHSISTEAAYYIWGFGASDAAHTVSPWSIPGDIIKRDQNSFVTLFVGLDTGIRPASFQGKDGLTNTGTLGDVATSPDLQNTIGYVSGEVADANRSTVHVLAYQHTGQTCGYWPDSTIDAFDKRNVRDGQYWLWSPVHFFAAIEGAGTITDPNTAAFIGYLDGSVAAPTGIDVFSAEVKSSTVPKCAMHAWRDGDLGAPYSYAPPIPCSCKFDELATGATTCTTCADDTGCTSSNAPKCRYGYCEAN